MFKEILSAISAIEAAPKRKTHMLDGIDVSRVQHIKPSNPFGIGLTLLDANRRPLVCFEEGNFVTLLERITKELHDITDELGQRYVVHQVLPGNLVVFDLANVVAIACYGGRGVELINEQGHISASHSHVLFEEVKPKLDKVFNARQVKKYGSAESAAPEAPVARPAKAVIAGHIVELAEVTSYKPWMGRTKGIVVMSGNEKLINHSDCDYEEESAKLEKALNLYLGY